VQEPSASYCHDIAVDPAAKVCLRGSSDTLVDVVDVGSGTRVALHETILSFGGLRLAISDDTRHFIAGSWGNPRGGGVACYETTSGKMVWHNRKLNRPQILGFESTTGRWFVSLDRGGTFFVERQSGEPVVTMRGSLREKLGNDADGNCLITSRTAIEVIDPRTGTIRRTLKPPPMYEWIAGINKFGHDDKVMTASYRHDDHQNKLIDRLNVLSSACVEDRVVIAHSGGAMQCLDITTAALLWETLPPPRSHFLDVGIDRNRNTVWARCWDFWRGGDTEGWELALDSGTIRARHPSNPTAGHNCVFCDQGRLMIDETGMFTPPNTRIRSFQ